MESELFEPQIISLILCFLDQRECGRLEYTSKKFHSHLNGLEFQRSLNLGRLYSFSEYYLNWVISRRVKFTMFYGGFDINDVLMDRTTVQKFADIILHSTNSAKIKFSSQGDWIFFFNYLHEQKPSKKLRRIDFEDCCLPKFDFGVLFDLFLISTNLILIFDLTIYFLGLLLVLFQLMIYAHPWGDSDL